jgi:hypothetical protein
MDINSKINTDNDTIIPIFTKNCKNYGIIVTDGYDKNLYRIKYFNLNTPDLLKRRIIRSTSSISDFFEFKPENILFKESLDFNIIMLCLHNKKLTEFIHDYDAHISSCSEYCKLMCTHFKDNITEIYTNLDKLIEDYPEVKYTEKELNKILGTTNYVIPQTIKSRIVERDPNPSQIYPNLYLGEVYHSCDTNFLKDKNIKHILTMLEYPCRLSTNPEFSYITFKHICINDYPFANILQYIPECVDFIKRAHANGENVYVHCAMGISRSVSIVIAYIMNTKNMKFDEALAYVRSCRAQADPNFGFVCQLLQYEKSLQ